MILKCPVCNGTCRVPSGFYHDCSDSDDKKYETCRCCNGTGTVKENSNNRNPEVDV